MVNRPLTPAGGGLRILAVIALGAAFLLISAGVRTAVSDGLAKCADLLVQYSPYSYVAVVVIVVGGFLTFLARGSSARD